MGYTDNKTSATADKRQGISFLSFALDSKVYSVTLLICDLLLISKIGVLDQVYVEGFFSFQLCQLKRNLKKVDYTVYYLLFQTCKNQMDLFK